MDLKKYVGHDVQIIDKKSVKWTGYADFYVSPEDNEPEGVASIDIVCKTGKKGFIGKTIDFYETEIKSITIIK